MTKIFFLFSILFSTVCFSQDYCSKNFTLKSDKAGEMRDTTRPEYLMPLETGINRNVDTIKLTFFVNGAFQDNKYFIIFKTICDTSKDKSRVIIFEGSTLEQVLSVDNENSSNTLKKQSFITINLDNKELVLTTTGRRDSLFLKLNYL